MRWLGTMLPLLALAGCATMTRGVTQSLSFDTRPPGAQVKASNGLACAVTPCTFEKVSRKAKFTAEVSLPGYATQTVEVDHTTSVEGGAKAALSFAIPGGILWSLIDVFSGATQDLRPNPAVVELKKQ